MKRAFITGITGQDGSYLTELLLEKGYEVHGLVHRPDRLGASNIAHLLDQTQGSDPRLFLHNGAFEDPTYLRRIIIKANPEEFYHLAGQSSPRISLEMPESTLESVGMGSLRLLEILRDMPVPPKCLIASSSEVFGSPSESPQTEETSPRPSTPYGAAKALAQQMARIYRQAYELPTCAAILYNHESTRRSVNFVTMKVARAVALIKLGRQKELHLGSLDGQRDWGWAPDYVLGMYLMLQQETVDDFILATGRLHSVRDLVEMAFSHAGLDWREFVKYDEALITKVEPALACGDSSKALRVLGWKCSVTLPEIMGRLVDFQLQKQGGGS
jgi:GDPmannose 4,6-dehydratase